ncbi:hypothetical protein [Plebeiibacterium sediminum]|uniref:Uncharacterized protein n=1 Tax=Plebeiibacterium sediminum TaxID=2992112 RepID=A0AAE3M110_9BACT|nr:hypothetical protein [Plebeiobacterium sediminum]MCW3785119.1 hypothetical protein [Plebeiobacterium sediminum]
MLKRIITISACVILGGVLLYAYFFLHDYKNYKNNNAIKGIPTDVSFIFRVDNPNNIIEFIQEKTEYSSDLKSFEWFNSFFSTISKLDSSEVYNNKAFNNLKNKSLTISLHQEGKSTLSPLFIYEVNNKAENKLLSSLLTENKPSDWSISERKYNSNFIYKIRDNKELFETYLSFENGLLLISPSSLIIEKSLRQLDTEYSLEKEKTFDQLFKTAGDNSDINLFINFKNSSDLLNNLLKHDIGNSLSFINKIGDWGELDINLSSDIISINGFIYPSKNHEKLSILLKGMNPSTSRISKCIPSNSTFYLSYNIDDSDILQNNLDAYLNATGNISSFNDKLHSYSNILETEEYLRTVFNFVEDEFALVFTPNNTSIQDEGKYLIIETISKSKTLKSLGNIIDSSIEPVYKYNLDTETAFPIYNAKGLEGISYIFNQFVPDPPSKFFTFIDNYLVFSNSINSLKSIIYSFELKKTLYHSKYYQQFNENFSYKENLFMYCDLSKISLIIPNESSNSILNPNKEQKDALSKFYGIGIQVSNANQLLYTNTCVEYLPVRENEPRTVWQSGLDSTIFSKPSIVLNHNTKEKEILVQDKSNILYLIANNGKILWQKKLDNPILSEIYQIDYYQNNKLQYLFNTKERIYLLDRNGNYVEKYPINFSHEATNGLALFDYDNNRNYRIFVACNNKETYVYDKSGKQIKGWKASQTEGIVNNPIQHFRINNKDYIVFSDDKRNYILNRKGNTRVTIKNDFIRNKNSLFYEFNNNSIITSDKMGNARLINLENGETSQIKLKNTDEEHYFISSDVTNNPENELLILTHDHLNLYTNKGNKIFSEEVEGNISLVADIYYFSSANKKIGIYDEKNQKIYLFNSNGNLYKNFPLKGKSRFSIGFLSSTSSQFNLIVGGDNNYLYNYRIE